MGSFHSVTHLFDSVDVNLSRNVCIYFQETIHPKDKHTGEKSQSWQMGGWHLGSCAAWRVARHLAGLAGEGG